MASVQHSRGTGNRYGGFHEQLIAQQWRTGRAKGRLTDRNPYTGDVLVEIPHASEQDLDEAFRGAAKAQRAWARQLPARRRT